MKLKTHLAAALIIAGLLNVNKLSAQSWNVTGNAGTTTSNFLGTTDAKDFKIRTNNSMRITVKSNGKVGIGTASPTAILHLEKGTLTDVLIKSTAAGAQITVDRAANGFEAVTRYMQTSVPQWKTGLTVNATGTPEYVIANEVTGSNALTISSSNLITLPAGSLTLGTTNASNLFKSGNDANLSAFTPTTASGLTPGNVIMAHTSLFGFKSGNVGIGTNDASLGKLVVQGSIGNTIGLFRRNTTSAGVSLIGDWPGLYLNCYSNGGSRVMAPGYAGAVNFNPTLGYLTLNVSATSGANAGDVLPIPEAMYIFNNGNVSIGTFSNSYKLDVCGTMRAKEVRVSTGWCDYVFADDYILPDLSEVETFIKANKHLPDVTPGAIIENEGLEVGKTAAQMIKKIEELTLYMIDMNKRMSEKDAQIEMLKSEFNKLK